MRPFPSLLLAALSGGALLALEAEGTLLARYPGVAPLLVKAKAQFAAGRLEAARQAFQACLAMLPSHHEAHFYLGQLAYQDKDYRGARDHIEAAERSLEDLDREYQARLKVQNARDAQSLLAAQKNVDYLTLEKGITEGSCSYSLVLLATQSLRTAQEASRHHALPEERPFTLPASYQFLHANCLFRLGDLDGAETLYLKTLELDPRHAGAWNNLVSLGLIRKQPETALRHLKAAEAAKIAIQPALRKAVLGT